MSPKTLLELAGVKPVKPRLSESTLLLIDCQNEYLQGPLVLAGVEAAVQQAARLLTAARACGGRIVHIVHRGYTGGLFDRAAWGGQIIDALTPRDGETVVEKPRPNSFSGTGLQAVIGAEGTSLVLAGFMTHMCVSSTARAALDLGYPVTVVSDACATRDLPVPHGSVMDAATLHRAELAALADRFAAVFPAAALLD